MNKLLAEHIFKPGAFPEYTYVSRKSFKDKVIEHFKETGKC
ncbi:hypothetical protein [Clostridium sp.]|nr:hypothetical protein [Clostridium sp.]